MSFMDGFSLGRIVTIHIYYSNKITGENIYSKLSLVDLAGSEGLTVENDSGEHVTDLLHVMNSFSAYVNLFVHYFYSLLSYQRAAHITSVFLSSKGLKKFSICRHQCMI